MANDKKFNKTTLSKKSLPDLKELLDEEGLEAEEDWLKADYIEALLEVPLSDDEEDDEEEDDEVDDVEESDDEEDDEEDDDIEVDEEPEPKPTKSKSKAKAKSGDSDTLAAKQVATELGVEAKVLRQFLRSSASTFEAVGSGGRYEFTQGDLPKIKEEFQTWQASKTTRTRSEGKSPRKGRSAPAGHTEIVEEVEELEIEDLDELDDDELD